MALSFNEVKKLSIRDKFHICYDGYLKEFAPETSFEEYMLLTLEEYCESSEDSFTGLSEYLDCLAYSYSNNLIATPFSLV